MVSSTRTALSSSRHHHHVPADASSSQPVHVALRRLPRQGNRIRSSVSVCRECRPPSTPVLASCSRRWAPDTRGRLPYRGINCSRSDQTGRTDHLIATGWSGGRQINQPFTLLPEFPALLLIRWNATNGSVDDRSAITGWQEAGHHAAPNRRLFFQRQRRSGVGGVRAGIWERWDVRTHRVLESGNRSLRCFASSIRAVSILVALTAPESREFRSFSPP